MRAHEIDAVSPGAASPPAAVVPEPGEVALVVHSSGTTAAPRPVELTHGNVLANALGCAVALGSDPDERWLAPMPLSHIGGLMVLARTAINAGTTILHPRFDGEAVLDALRGEAVTIVSLVPTMLARLLDAGLAERPDALRVIMLGGGPAAPALLARARAAGLPVVQTYGLTQGCSAVAISGIGEAGSAGSAGRALPGLRLHVASDGEILVAGPSIAPGELDADGWLHSGDLGALDDHGRLTVTGRASLTIVSGGENVSPEAVEAVLSDHPSIAEAAVLGRPDPEWGEAVTALVVPRSGAALDPDALRAHCAGRLARHEVPKVFKAVAALPRTASGKVRRGELA